MLLYIVGFCERWYAVLVPKVPPPTIRTDLEGDILSVMMYTADDSGNG